jgi:hypothetical protein
MCTCIFESFLSPAQVIDSTSIQKISPKVEYEH